MSASRMGRGVSSRASWRIRSRGRRRGFTLMEVLLVLVILVIMASLVGTSIMSAKRRALEDATKAQMSSLKSALQQYSLDVGTFPTTQQGLAALIEAPGDLRNVSKWRGPYLEGDVPLDAWQNDFSYESSGGQYTIVSGGPNGQIENGGDDIFFTGQ